MQLDYALENLDATRRLADDVVAAAGRPLTIALNGSLGSGKTQFVRFLAQALGVQGHEVTSPTYVLLQRYAGEQVIYHLDFYRLDSAAQVWDLGLDELYEQSCWILIEWADKFPECLPESYLQIAFVECGQAARHVTVAGLGQAIEAVATLERLWPQVPEER